MAIEDENQFSNARRIATVLRWLVMIPAAVTAALVGRWLVVFVFGISISRYVEPDTFMWRVGTQYASGSALGALFVLVAIVVAPSHKKVVAAASAGVVLVLAGFVLFPSIMAGDHWVILEIAFMIFGAASIAGGVLFRTDDEPNW